MKKISAPAAPVNDTLSPMSGSCNSLSSLCFRASDCHPRMYDRNSSNSPGAAALPSTVSRLRTSLTFSTKLSPNLCMLTLTTSLPFIPFDSARPSKQPLMVRTFLKVYMELGSYFLFLHIISARPSKQPRMVGSTLGVYSFGLIFVSARTNKDDDVFYLFLQKQNRT